MVTPPSSASVCAAGLSWRFRVLHNGKRGYMSNFVRGPRWMRGGGTRYCPLPQSACQKEKPMEAFGKSSREPLIIIVIIKRRRRRRESQKGSSLFFCSKLCDTTHQIYEKRNAKKLKLETTASYVRLVPRPHTSRMLLRHDLFLRWLDEPWLFVSCWGPCITLLSWSQNMTVTNKPKRRHSTRKITWKTNTITKSLFRRRKTFREVSHSSFCWKCCHKSFNSTSSVNSLCGSDDSDGIRTVGPRLLPPRRDAKIWKPPTLRIHR